MQDGLVKPAFQVALLSSQRDAITVQLVGAKGPSGDPEAVYYFERRGGLRPGEGGGVAGAPLQGCRTSWSSLVQAARNRPNDAEKDCANAAPGPDEDDLPRAAGAYTAAEARVLASG